MRHTWGETYAFAARHGLDTDEVPTPAEIAEDDREHDRFMAERAREDRDDRR